MSRLSGPKRKKLFEQLVRRDGPVCFIGGESGTAKTLLIDHLNNMNSDNRLSNLHIMCRSMNVVKNPRHRSRKQSSVYMEEAEPEKTRINSAEFAKNLQSEPDFRHWLFAEVWRNGRVEWEEALDCGASIARCSQETIRRYLKKEASRVRPYRVVEDQETKTKYVVFRENWEQVRRKEEERRANDRLSSEGVKQVLENSGIARLGARRKAGKVPQEAGTGSQAGPGEGQQ